MDKLLKGLWLDGDISVALLDTTETVKKAAAIHKTSPVATAALGRSLTVGAYMSSDLKNEDDNLSITIHGDGAGGSIVVCGNSKLEIRGYIENPHQDLPLRPDGKLNVGGLVGRGRITVVKNMGLKKPYMGTAAIMSGEIAEDFASYYTYSEQRPTAICLGVKIDRDYSVIASGGLILQAMPNAKEESLDKAERLSEEFSKISSMIEEYGINGLIDRFFKEVDFTEYHPIYKCTCSKDYVDRVLMTLGKAELYETIEKEGKVEVLCHFCPNKYTYLKEDIDELFKTNDEHSKNT